MGTAGLHDPANWNSAIISTLTAPVWQQRSPIGASDFGPTQNLWFTHDGHLFEVLTYPTQGPWLTQIIATIRF